MSSSARERLRRQQEQQAEAARRRRIMLVAGIVALLVILGITATSIASKLKDPQAPSAAAIVPPSANAAKDAIVVNPGKAPSTAPLLSIYFDYQCPNCKQFEALLGPTIEDMAHKGEVTLQYHGMTFLDSNLRNDSSTRSGYAAACADTVGAYAAYHDAVFAGQPAQEGAGYTDEQLRVAFAQQAGITGDKLTSFQQCYDARATKGFVDAMNESAFRQGVNSTPTVQVNGKQLSLDTVTDPASFRQAVLDAAK